MSAGLRPGESANKLAGASSSGMTYGETAISVLLKPIRIRKGL